MNNVKFATTPAEILGGGFLQVFRERISFRRILQDEKTFQGDLSMECKQKKNSEQCSCTYSSCGNRGVCCDCLRSHLKNHELPGCCFPPEAEKTYDRSFENFARAWKLAK